MILAKRMERGLFSRINPMYRGEVTLTAAEFALFFEGADLERRFISRPRSAPLIDCPMGIKIIERVPVCKSFLVCMRRPHDLKFGPPDRDPKENLFPNACFCAQRLFRSEKSISCKTGSVES